MLALVVKHEPNAFLTIVNHMLDRIDKCDEAVAGKRRGVESKRKKTRCVQMEPGGWDGSDGRGAVTVRGTGPPTEGAPMIQVRKLSSFLRMTTGS